MKEDALRHLLLLRGEHISRENPTLSEPVRELVSSLTVQSKGRGTFEILFTVAGKPETLVTEPGDFVFYRRGDVPRVGERGHPSHDLRNHNWKSATQIWQRLLGVELPETHVRLAFESTVSRPNTHRFGSPVVQTAVALVPLIFAMFLWRRSRAFAAISDAKAIRERINPIGPVHPLPRIGRMFSTVITESRLRDLLGVASLITFVRQAERDATTSWSLPAFLTCLASIMLGFLSRPLKVVHQLVAATNVVYGIISRKRSLTLENLVFLTLSSLSARLMGQSNSSHTASKPSMLDAVTSLTLVAESAARLLHGYRRQLSDIVWPTAAGIVLLRVPTSTFLRKGFLGASGVSLVLRSNGNRTSIPRQNHHIRFQHLSTNDATPVQIRGKLQ